MVLLLDLLIWRWKSYYQLFWLGKLRWLTSNFHTVVRQVDLNEAWDTSKVSINWYWHWWFDGILWNLPGPWVQDFTMSVWNQFLEGTDMARKNCFSRLKFST